MSSSTKNPVRPSSSSSGVSANNSARRMAQDYNKNIRMTMGGTGKNAKIYSVTDNWASHYKPRDETRTFANAVGFTRRIAATPFRIPGREEQTMAATEADNALKFSGADVHATGQPTLKKKLLRGLPLNPLRRDGTPYWHFAEPVTIAETTAGSPSPKSAACYFNESVTRPPSTIPNLSIALLPPGEVFAAQNDDNDIALFSDLSRKRKMKKEQEKSNAYSSSYSPSSRYHQTSSSKFSTTTTASVAHHHQTLAELVAPSKRSCMCDTT